MTMNKVNQEVTETVELVEVVLITKGHLDKKSLPKTTW